MLVEHPAEKLMSLGARGRSLRNCEYGCAIFGFSVYGEEPTVLNFGNGKTGVASGIFQRRRNGGKVVLALERYYVPKNPQTIPQQAHRQTFADAVVAWQALTTIQKQVYNENSREKKMSGYNLFLREYLKSH